MSADSGLEGKGSGDITATTGTTPAADIIEGKAHATTLSSPVLNNSASTDNSKTEKISVGVAGVDMLTGFNSVDIDGFVQQSRAEAASNEGEEEEDKAVKMQSNSVDLAVHTDRFNSTATTSTSVNITAKACPTCGTDKNTTAAVTASSAEIMMVSSSDSSVTATSSSQSHLRAAAASITSEQDRNIDEKEGKTVNLGGSRGTENLPIASTSPVEGTLGQNPRDVTDAVLTASLYIIGALICAIVVRRLLLLFLLARSHMPDSDRGDL